MMETNLLPLSPSFNSYSSTNFSQIASRVVDEFLKESHPSSISKPDHENAVPELAVEEDDDFEFAVVPQEPYTTTISAADDIFYNGQIKPTYPFFNTNLLLNNSPSSPIANNNVIVDDDFKKLKTARVHRPSLGKLMSQDRETNSCSSSEADELDGILPGTYCVWSPKESLERCKKSNSMGSSKRWKLRDLLHRSNSDGKDVFLFLTPNKKVAGVSSGKGTDEEMIAGKLKSSRVAAAAAVKGEEDKKGTSVPYRRDLVGLFNNVNGMKNRKMDLI